MAKKRTPQQVYSVAITKTEKNNLEIVVHSKIDLSPIKIKNIASVTIKNLHGVDEYILSIFVREEKTDNQVELRLNSRYLILKNLGDFEISKVNLNKKEFSTEEYYYNRVSPYTYINFYVTKLLFIPAVIENFRKVF